MGATNGIPERMDQDTVIEMVDAGQYRREFGITAESARLFRIEGYGDTPHRVMVWDNTVHPIGNTLRDPFGCLTTDRTTITVKALPTVISAHTLAGPGFSATKLHIGQTVKLMWPDGSLSDPYIIQARPESAAMLTPVK